LINESSKSGAILHYSKHLKNTDLYYFSGLCISDYRWPN